MSARFRLVFTSLASCAGLLLTSTSFAATWQTNVNYGGGGSPTMDLYVPDSVDELPGIVVALHYCGGSANAAHGWFQSLADEHGFIIIAGDSANNCWDSSPGRTGEKAAIVQMVNYTIDEYGADATRVFSAGASSGACLTNSLLASYPDVFAGGSVLAGVPAGAWPSGNTSCNNVCNTTPGTKTAVQWGDIVRSAFAFDGPRPKVQLFHGSADEYLYYPYLAEEVKQWTNVLGFSETPTSQTSNQPSSGWERASYEDGAGQLMLEVNSKQGEVHDLTGKGLFPDVIRFFGLDQDAPVGGGSGGADAGGGGGTPGVGGMPSGGEASGDSPGSGGASTGEMSSGGAVNTAAGGSTLASSGGAPSGTPSGGSSGTLDPSTGAEDDTVNDGSGCQIARGPRPLGVMGLLLLGSVAALLRRRRTVA